MENTINFISLLTIFYTSIFNLSPSLQYTGKHVNAYLDYLMSYKMVDYEQDTVSATGLKYAAKLMFMAQEEDAVLKQKKYSEYNVLNNSCRVNFFTKPAWTKYRLLFKFKDTLAPVIHHLLVSDYLLKVTIKGVKDVPYYSKDYPGVFRSMRRVVTVTVDDILKGENRFKKGEETEFFYFTGWEMGSGRSFKPGENYLVQLCVSEGENGNYDWLAFNMVEGDKTNHNEMMIDIFDDGSGRIYDNFPIVEGKVTDKYNFWGFGDNLPWDEFKEKMMENINLIKSW